MTHPHRVAICFCTLLRQLPLGLRFTLAQLFKPVLDSALADVGNARYSYAGLQLDSDLTEHVPREMFKLGWYEHPFIDALARFAQPGDVLLDIGANVGNYSLALHQRYARIIAFEPNSANASILRKALLENHIDNVDLMEIALSDSASSGVLYVNTAGNTGNASLDPASIQSADAAAVTVNMNTGDAALAELGIEAVAAIKIDVEGAEVRALQGLRHTLQRCRPLVQMEWHGSMMQRANAIPALQSLLPDYAYFVAISSDRSRVRKVLRRILSNAIYDHMQPTRLDYADIHEAVFAVPDEKVASFLTIGGPRQ